MASQTSGFISDLTDQNRKRTRTASMEAESINEGSPLPTLNRRISKRVRRIEEALSSDNEIEGSGLLSVVPVSPSPEIPDGSNVSVCVPSSAYSNVASSSLSHIKLQTRRKRVQQ